MNNSPFDDHIKKQFGNYQPEVPPHIWENIMAEKKKRRPGAIVFGLSGKKIAVLLLLVIAGGIGTAVLFNNKQTNSQQEASPIITSVNDNPGSNNTDNKKIPGQSPATSTSTNEKPSLNDNDNSTIQTAIPGKPGNMSAAKNDDGKSGDEVTSAVANDKSGKSNLDNNGTTGSGTLAISENKKVATSHTNKETKANKLNSGLDKKILVSANKPQTPGNNIAEFNSKKSKHLRGMARMNTMKADTDLDDGRNETLLTNENTSTQTAREATLNNYYLHPELIDFSRISSFNIKSSNIPGMHIPCPGSDKKGNGRTKYLELYVGPDYVFRSFSDTANSVYKQKRKESTKFSSAFSFGLRYTKLFNNFVSIRAGINYSQVNEKFNYEQGHIVQTVNIYDENGNVIGSYATTSTRYKTTHNRYHTIDIPVTVGYEMGNDRLRANINAGVVLNIYSWQKGDLLDYNYEPVNITTGKSSSPYQFKTNAGLGVIAGASVYYRLTGRLHLMAEPYIRYNFSAANKADITLKQKFTTAGVKFGLRIDF